MDPPDLRGLVYDEFTRWPVDFDPDAAGARLVRGGNGWLSWGADDQDTGLAEAGRPRLELTADVWKIHYHRVWTGPASRGSAPPLRHAGR